MYTVKQNIKISIKSYIATIVGGIIAGLSFNLFLLPNKIAPAGVGGIATIISRLIGGNIGLIAIIINLPIYAISFKRLGKDFILKSIVGMLAMSFAIDFIKVRPVVENDALLGAVFGGLMLGAGLGTAFRFMGSTGGVDVIAKLIVHWYSEVSIGGCVMMLDVAVIIVNGLLLGNSAYTVLYSFIALMISGYVIDVLQNGLKSARVYYIVTDKGDEISRRINTELSRGVTKIEAIGAYTGKHKAMLVCLVLPSEAAQLRSIIKIDENAFAYTVDAREVNGLGFGVDDGSRFA